MAPASGKQKREVLSSGDRRMHIVHVPRQYDHTRPIPVIVVLHGGGGSARFAYRVHGWPELAERETCLIVFPEGTLEDPTKPPSLRDNLRLWNDGSTRSAVARRNVDDIGYLTSVLDDLQTSFNVDPNRIFVTGFSNGASMTFRVGVELAHRIKAIAPVSGHLCIDNPQLARPLSLLYMIGLADPINPVAGGTVTTPWGTRRNKPAIMDSINTWIRLIGAPEQPIFSDIKNGVKQIRYGPGLHRSEVLLYLIEGQGHEWPGAQRTLPRSLSGPQTDRLNATEVIWDFFNSNGGRAQQRAGTSC